MLSYETLDAIADSYNPLLGITALLILARTLITKRWRRAGIQILQLVAVLGIAYGLKFLDDRFGIWPRFGLDYSTHTAVALALVLFLVINTYKLRIVWIVSLAAYAGLMLYQRYHTIADILVTALIVVVPAALGLRYLHYFTGVDTRTSTDPRRRA